LLYSFFPLGINVRNVFAALYVTAYVPHIQRYVGLRKNLIGWCIILIQLDLILDHTVVVVVVVVVVVANEDSVANAADRCTKALSMTVKNGAATAVTVIATNTSPTNFVANVWVSLFQSLETELLSLNKTAVAAISTLGSGGTMDCGMFGVGELTTCVEKPVVTVANGWLTLGGDKDMTEGIDVMFFLSLGIDGGIIFLLLRERTTKQKYGERHNFLRCE
jgi:hypothetical protein